MRLAETETVLGKMINKKEGKVGTLQRALPRSAAKQTRPRGLRGRGRAEERKALWEWGLGRGRQTRGRRETRGKREMRDKRGKSQRKRAVSGGTFKGCTCHIAGGGMAPVGSG